MLEIFSMSGSICGNRVAASVCWKNGDQHVLRCRRERGGENKGDDSDMVETKRDE